MTFRRLPLTELPGWPRLLPYALAIAYCGGSKTRFDRMLADGKLPGPDDEGLFDRAAIDKVINRRSGLDAAEEEADPDGQRTRWLEGFGSGHRAG